MNPASPLLTTLTHGRGVLGVVIVNSVPSCENCPYFVLNTMSSVGVASVGKMLEAHSKCQSLCRFQAPMICPRIVKVEGKSDDIIFQSCPKGKPDF